MESAPLLHGAPSPAPAGAHPLTDADDQPWIRRRIGAVAALGLAAAALLALTRQTSTLQPASPTTALQKSRTADAAASSNPTHVVFILSDDQGYNDIGYSSNDMAGLTPVIDALAADGVKLTQYYGQSLCTPARGALMTGKYPIHIGLHHDVIHPDAPWGLPLQEKMLPQYLKTTAGFKCHLIGKWHLGHFATEYMPAARGFDSYYGYLTDTVKYYTHKYPDSFQGNSFYDLVKQESSMANYPLNYSSDDDARGEYTTTLFTAAADNVMSAHDPSEPLFLFMSFQNVHEPHTPAPEDTWMSQSELALLNNVSTPTRRAFAKSLVMLDHGVRNLTSSLERHGLRDNTLLVFSSDNGGCPQFGGYNYPLRGMKYYLFEGGMRVHGFVQGSLLPDAARGTTFDGIMHLTDWIPTLLTAVGADVADGALDELDGVDQWAALTSNGAVDAPREELLYNIDPYYASVEQHADGSMTEKLIEGTPRAAIRVGPWKLLLHEYCVSTFNPLSAPNASSGCGQDSCATPGNDVNASDLLFNLVDDPFEENNVIEKHPAIAKELMTKVQQYAQSMVTTHYRSTDAMAYQVWSESGFITPWTRPNAEER